MPYHYGFGNGDALITVTAPFPFCTGKALGTRLLISTYTIGLGCHYNVYLGSGLGGGGGGGLV